MQFFFTVLLLYSHLQYTTTTLNEVTKEEL